MKRVSKVIKEKLFFVLLVAGTTMLVGCQGQQIVTGVDARTVTINDRANIELTVQFGNFGFYLPSISVPIKDPNDPSGNVFGSVMVLANMATGGMDIIVQADLQTIIQEDTFPVGTHLPNGVPIPLTGVQYDTTFGIPIPIPGEKEMVLYFNISREFSMLGFAVPIKEFGTLTQYLGGMTVFPVIRIKDKTYGCAGIYLSDEADKSGIGAFINISDIITTFYPEYTDDLVVYGAMAKMASAPAGGSDAKIGSIGASKRKKKKLYRRLNKLRKKTRGKLSF